METAIVIIVIMLIIAIRIIAGWLDDGWIKGYLSERNCTLIEKKWQPFGPGWFGEKDSRIYEVTYRDAEGNIHQAYTKVSLFSGVYFTEDRITQKKPYDAPIPQEPHATTANREREQKPQNNENNENNATVLKRRLAQLENEWTKTSEHLANLDAQIAAATQDLADLENGKQE